MNTPALRTCPCCGGPAEHSVLLRQADPAAVEQIKCAWCGLSLQADVSTHAELADLWNTRVTDTLLRDAIPSLRMLTSLFREQGLPASTETGLLQRILDHLGEAP